MEGSERSWDWAAAMIECSELVRNLESGTHFRLTTTVAVIEPSVANTKELVLGANIAFDDLTVEKDDKGRCGFWRL